jgi:hypothetical protein
MTMQGVAMGYLQKGVMTSQPNFLIFFGDLFDFGE